MIIRLFEKQNDEFDDFDKFKILVIYVKKYQFQNYFSKLKFV